MWKLGRPSPALVIACLALFVAGSGGAWAANGGLASARSTSPAKSKPLKRGPRGPRGFRGIQGARGLQGQAGAQGPAGAIGPSDGYVKRAAAATPLPAGVATTVAQLTLPAGSGYIITAATELGNASAMAGLVACTLLEGATPIGAGSASLSSANVFAQTITLTAATTGGVISLSCNPDNSGQARNNVITAVQVGTLHTQ
jgi:hypothetical protein